MTPHETHPCPDDILAAIPWYPTDLDEITRGEVESHAAQCAACRDEIAFVHEGAPIEVDVENRDRVYEKLLARIEEHEGARPSAAATAASAPARSGPRVSWPLALAASFALAVVSGGLGVASSQWFESTPQPVYDTASDASAAAPASGPAIEVVFREDAKAEDIHAALRAVGGQIVSGPTQLGVYRVELAAGSDVSTAAQRLRGEELGVATFAEPSLR